MAPDADATAGTPKGWHDLEAVLAEEPVATLLAAYLALSVHGPVTSRLCVLAIASRHHGTGLLPNAGCVVGASADGGQATSPTEGAYPRTMSRGRCRARPTAHRVRSGRRARGASAPPRARAGRVAR